jgi:uncharacterized protein (TIGR03067 family)
MGASLLFIAVAVGAPALKDRPARPLIVGEWEAEASTTAGPKFTASITFADPRPRFTFTADGRWLDGGRAVGRYTLDPKASPTAITLSRAADGPAGGPAQDLTGTFRVDGDALTLALNTGPDGAVWTSTFRRARKE